MIMIHLIRAELTNKEVIVLISLDIEGAFDNAWIDSYFENIIVRVRIRSKMGR